MNKLFLLAIILGFLLVLYWFQSKIEKKYESDTISEKDFANLTDNSQNTIDSEESHKTLRSFNSNILKTDNHTNLSNASSHKLRKIKEEDSNFDDSDSDLNDGRDMETRLSDLDD